MALKLFVLVSLCVIAAAGDEYATIIWAGARRSLDCRVPGSERLQARRSPPPPLEAQDSVQHKPYKWTHNGTEIYHYRISKNGSLDLPKDALPGIYQCSSNVGGVVLGYPYNVKVPYAKVIAADPNEMQARIGQPLAIPCYVDSSPLANISWQKHGKALVEDSRIYVLKKQLLITDVKSEDAAIYTCTATNPVLKKTVTSHPVRVHVVESNDELDPSFLDLEDEQDIVVEKGSRVQLPCPVIAWPKVGIIWYWTRPGDVMASELESVSEVLALDAFQVDQNGGYTCSVDGGKRLTKKFNVMVKEPPTIVIPPANKASPRASTVRFNCTATGSPEPEVTWYKDGKILSMGGEMKLLKSADSKRIELVISTVTSDAAGIYQCFARSRAGVSSSWAALVVTGAGELPPAGLRCTPLSAKVVELSWSHPKNETIMAYTLSVTPFDPFFISEPTNKTKRVQTMKEALTPYTFEVTAFTKAAASDKSESVTCQGQGVPIQLKKKEDNVVLVSWNAFAEENPGVVQWKLQYREKKSVLVHNVTLDGAVTNYSIHAPAAQPLEVRVLGSRRARWPPADLTRLPWTPTNGPRDDRVTDDIYPVPSDLKATEVGAHSFALSWRCDEAVNSPKRYMFYVCIKKLGYSGTSFCSESQRNSTLIEHVDSDSEYEVRVQACLVDKDLKGPYSRPYTVRTLPEESKRSFYYSVLNSTAALVWWRGAPVRTEVKYAAELKLPLDAWNRTKVYGNNAVITINPSSPTYVTVLGLDSSENTKILTIPMQEDGELKDFNQEYVSGGVRVWWSGPLSRYAVRYSQEISEPVEQWDTVDVDEPSVVLKHLNHSLATYVMVTPALADSSPRMITIKPFKEESSSLYLGIGVGCGVVVLALLLAAALCIWRRRKRMRSPVRSRRRNASGTESNDEEAAEMKNVGGRLANGGTSRGAGEPLLNGHVHITENPTPKTPNGKKKPQRYDAAFDVSRFEDDTTQETVLDTDTTMYTTLDASRHSGVDTTRDLNITANDSFNKLPDDNMNSELNLDSAYIDKGNSKLQPTLQPNG